MGQATEFVRVGSYIDWGRSVKSQWLLPDLAANTLTTFLGILVTIALARLWRIFGRIYERAGFAFLTRSEWDFSHARTQTVNFVHARTQNENNRLGIAIESEGFHRVLEAAKNMREFPGPIRLPGRGSHKHKYRDMAIGLVLMLVYVGINVCGVVTTFLGTDRVALSAHPGCGIWIKDITSPSERFRESLPLEFSKELESATWAENCYGSSAKFDSCSFFLSREIQYTMVDNDSCPFHDMCYSGSTSAFTLDTGAINARAVGINAPKTYEFRRSATCSPLNMNESFVQLINVNNFTRRFRYHYGSSEGFGDVSWETNIYGYYSGDIGGYSLDMVRSGGQSWIPMIQLRPPMAAITSVIFINSGKIFYTSPSDDPIFPATKLLKFPTGDEYYQNVRGHAGVLACVESMEIRDPTASEEWISILEPRDPIYDDVQSRGGYWLLWRSLLYSSIYSSASVRSGAALDAQNRIAQRISLPLDREQWKVEVEKLFAASLARIQVEAKDIARGTGAGLPGYYKSETEANICDNTYLFNSEGYTNIDRVGYIWILSLCILFILFGVPWTKEALWWETLILDPVKDGDFERRLADIWKSIFGRNGYIAGAWAAILELFQEGGFLYEMLQKSWGFLEGWDIWRSMQSMGRF